MSNDTSPRPVWGIIFILGVIKMFIPVYQGQKFSFSYEVGTGHYLLYSNDYKTHKYLHGVDARIFREEIERIDNLPPPQCNDGRLTDNAIEIYL